MGTRLRRLGTEDLSWGDLWTIVSCSPHDSPLARKLEPDSAPWDTTNFLLHSIEYQMRIANWFETEDGHKNRKHPKQIPAPWVKQDAEVEVKHFGTEPVPLGELDSLLGWSAA